MSETLTIIISILVPVMSAFFWLFLRMDSKFDRLIDRIEKMSDRVNTIESRLTAVETRLGFVERLLEMMGGLNKFPKERTDP